MVFPGDNVYFGLNRFLETSCSSLVCINCFPVHAVFRILYCLLCEQMAEVYNSTYKELRIMSYEYRQTLGPYIKFFLDAPDELILEVRHVIYNLRVS